MTKINFHGTILGKYWMENKRLKKRKIIIDLVNFSLFSISISMTIISEISTTTQDKVIGGLQPHTLLMLTLITCDCLLLLRSA